MRLVAFGVGVVVSIAGVLFMYSLIYEEEGKESKKSKETGR